jgi:hypothetical protein
MLEIETPAAMAEWVGRKLGVSEWFTVDQNTIDLFAEATGITSGSTSMPSVRPASCPAAGPSRMAS